MVGAAPTGDAPTTSEWSTILLPTKGRLILEVLRYLSSSSSDSSRHPDIPSYNEVLEARDRIAPHVHRTPVFTSSYLDQLTGRKLFFKCENFQKTGSFKARGAVNAVSVTIWRQHHRQEGGRCVSCQYVLLNWYIYKLQHCMACRFFASKPLRAHVLA